MSIKPLLIILLVSFMLFSGSAYAASPGSIDIVATTSVLGEPLQYIGGDKVNVITISNPLLCPHMQSDVIPNNIQMNAGFIKSADMFAANDGSIDKTYVMPYVDDFMKANAVGVPQWTTLKDPGMTWNTPDKAVMLASEVKGWLAAKDPANASYYEQRYNEYVAKIYGANVTEQEKAVLGQQEVVAILWQQEPVEKWLGMKVVNTFAPEFAMNGTKAPAKIVDDIKANPAKYKNVTFIIENMQSGEMAKGIEEALNDIGVKAKRVIFTNFPKSVAGVETLPDVLEYNKNLILDNVPSATPTPVASPTPKATPIGIEVIVAGIVAGSAAVYLRKRN